MTHAPLRHPGATRAVRPLALLVLLAACAGTAGPPARDGTPTARAAPAAVGAAGAAAVGAAPVAGGVAQDAGAEPAADEDPSDGPPPAGAEAGDVSTDGARADQESPEPPADAPTAPAGRLAAAGLVHVPEARDEVVRRVGDVDIHASDVFRMLDLAAPERSADILSNMVLTALAEQEAVREAIDVPADALQGRVEQALAEQGARFALESGSDVGLEAYLLEVHGMSAEDYRDHVRRGVLSEMLLARVARLQQLRETRDLLQILLVEEEALADEIAAKLEAGASFAVLAKQHSVHGSAEQGGLMPPISLEVTAPMLEGREGLEPGGVLGPAPVTLGGDDYYRFLRLVERREPVEGGWDALREVVETDLAETPMNPDEVAIFEARMLARYRVHRPERTP